MSGLLQGEVVLVTGASRGIGAAIADTLAAQGATVIGTATSDAGAQTIGERLAAVGGHGRRLNVNETGAIEALVDAVSSEFGNISILVNNAGITRDNLLIRMTDEEFDKVLNVNLRAAFVATRTAAKSMLRNKFGRIVNISSVSGVIGNAGQANYSTSKAGLIGLAKTTARELAKKNVTANCVAPGFIDTEMARKLPEPVLEAAKQLIPMRRLGSMADIAKAVAFLTSDDAGYITGQVLCVDGGMAM